MRTYIKIKLIVLSVGAIGLFSTAGFAFNWEDFVVPLQIDIKAKPNADFRTKGDTAKAPIELTSPCPLGYREKKDEADKCISEERMRDLIWAFAKEQGCGGTSEPFYFPRMPDFYTRTAIMSTLISTCDCKFDERGLELFVELGINWDQFRTLVADIKNNLIDCYKNKIQNIVPTYCEVMSPWSNACPTPFKMEKRSLYAYTCSYKDEKVIKVGQIPDVSVLDNNCITGYNQDNITYSGEGFISDTVTFKCVSDGHNIDDPCPGQNSIMSLISEDFSTNVCCVTITPKLDLLENVNPKEKINGGSTFQTNDFLKQ